MAGKGCKGASSAGIHKARVHGSTCVRQQWCSRRAISSRRQQPRFAPPTCRAPQLPGVRPLQLRGRRGLPRCPALRLASCAGASRQELGVCRQQVQSAVQCFLHQQAMPD